MKIYNTQSEKKEIFEPIEKNKVKMYSCGPTVYSTPHIGNMRAYIHSDTIKRLLKHLGYKVTHVINITDVGHLTSDDDIGDDKMEKQALKEGKKSYEIADFYTQQFVQYLNDLNILKPDFMPKATEYIQEQIELVKTLEDKGYTYKIDDGIYFNTKKIKNYAQIAKINEEGLIAGFRVPLGNKKNPTDFALWKFSPIDTKRDMEWNSPWGIGFPGWHIECSAMAMNLLGDTIDIHTGGIDHIHVHHASEMAQSQSATNKNFVNYWSHVNFLTTDVKMSKSKGNVITIDTLKEKGFSPLHLRYFYLLAHYRSELKFDLSFHHLTSAKNAYEHLKNRALALKEIEEKENKKINDMFLNFLKDDLNTPEAIAYLQTVLKNKDIKNEHKKSLLTISNNLLGLELFEETKTNIPEEIIKLAEEREIARKNKNWTTADYFRNSIKEKGYNIKDEKKGYVIKKI